MRKYIFSGIALVICIMWTVSVKGQSNTKEIYYYKKSERNVGIHFKGTENREELRSDLSRNFEQLTTGSAQLQFTSRFWNYLDFKQEQFEFNFEVGPLGGAGNWIDSSFNANVEADHKILGIRTNANISYSNRFYYDRKNFTIVDVSAWGMYDLYKQNSEGTRIDSANHSFPYDDSDNMKKFRYGFQAKAGWGFGRLNPMNDFMLADYITDKYYKGRNFSKSEIVELADEIGRIKQYRNLKSLRNSNKESEQLTDFISNKMLLSAPENISNEWKYCEFLPRFNGKRLELGPFFNYFNREPDFIYGAYLKAEYAKYINYKWNRNFGLNLNYNRYKSRDWMLAEVNLGWSYFPNLKCQWDFGLKYIPGMVVNEFTDIEPISHNFIPYFGYYTQVNDKLRIKADASLRISDDEQFILAGPEFSLKVYWSKY